MFQVRPNLYLSSYAAARSQAPANAFIVNCTRDLPNLTPDAHRVAVDDIPDSKNNREMFMALSGAVAAAQAALDAGRSVVVHCHAGQQRSPTVVAAFLMAKDGMGLKDAVRAVRAAKPDALFWEVHFQVALEWFAQSLHL